MTLETPEELRLELSRELRRNARLQPAQVLKPSRRKRDHPKKTTRVVLKAKEEVKVKVRLTRRVESKRGSCSAIMSRTDRPVRSTRKENVHTVTGRISSIKTESLSEDPVQERIVKEEDVEELKEKLPKEMTILGMYRLRLIQARWSS